MAKRRTAMRSSKPANFGSMILVSIVVVMVLVVIFFKNQELDTKKNALLKKESYLLEQIDAQNERSEEIEEYRKYMQTKQYIEDMAKSKLGLVYKDEIIFEAND